MSHEILLVLPHDQLSPSLALTHTPSGGCDAREPNVSTASNEMYNTCNRSIVIFHSCCCCCCWCAVFVVHSFDFASSKLYTTLSAHGWLRVCLWIIPNRNYYCDSQSYAMHNTIVQTVSTVVAREVNWFQWNWIFARFACARLTEAKRSSERQTRQQTKKILWNRYICTMRHLLRQISCCYQLFLPYFLFDGWLVPLYCCCCGCCRCCCHCSWASGCLCLAELATINITTTSYYIRRRFYYYQWNVLCAVVSFYFELRNCHVSPEYTLILCTPRCLFRYLFLSFPPYYTVLDQRCKSRANATACILMSATDSLTDCTTHIFVGFGK